MCPPTGGSKYEPKDEVMAATIYQLPNLVLLCARCNMNAANSMRDFLLCHNMDVYGEEEVVRVLREIAALVKSASSWMPYSIEYKGKEVKILWDNTGKQ